MKYSALLTAAAAIAGWLLVTAGVAQLAPARVVWPLSIGVLLFAVPGLRNLRDIFAEGLHALMLDDSLTSEKDDA